MIDMTCPWCDKETGVDPRSLQGPDAGFTCADCGTSVLFVDEPAPALEMAA